MHAVGHRLAQRGLGKGDVVAYVIDMVRPDREIVPPGAHAAPPGLGPRRDTVRAEVGVPLPAAAALPAGDRRIHRYPVADLKTRHVLSDLRDHAGALMAQHHRREAEDMLADVGVQVRAADARGLHPDQNVVRPDLGNGNIPHPHYFYFFQKCSSHVCFLSFSGSMRSAAMSRCPAQR